MTRRPSTCIASISKRARVTLEATNPGDVLTWTTDNDFVIRAATAFDGKSGNTLIRVRDAVDKPWRDLVVMPFEQALFDGQVVGGSLIAGFAPDGKSLIIHSALHSDTGRLVRVDLRDGKELEVLAQDPQADVADSGPGSGPSVLCDPMTHAIQAVEFDYMKPAWVFLDPKVEADFAVIGKDMPAFLDLVSRDRADKKWIVAIRRSEAPAAYFFFDRTTKKRHWLFDEQPALTKSYRAPKKPVVIKARNGLELVSYLTTPLGVPAKNLPLVLAHSWRSMVSRQLRFRSGGAAVGEPWLCRAPGELSRLDRLWAEVSKRRD